MSDLPFKVVTWSTKTDKAFPTYEEALQYIRTSPDSEDWYIESPNSPKEPK